MTRKNILLISPDQENEGLWVSGEEGPEVKNNLVPLGLATLAALTPDTFHVDIWDEVVHGLIEDDTRLEKEYALVGITGYKAHLPRCRRVAAVFRKRGIPVVIGGPGVSGTPDDYRKDFDVLFIGEAELTWPRFLRDWENGGYRPEYRQIDKVDLTASPVPRWESIAGDISRYSFGAIQTTRGCPFDCEFCDVIYLFGRRPRHKQVDTVLEEIRVLQRLGAKKIFFADDEFIGDRKFVKELLPKISEINRSFPEPLTFSTQLTMTVRRDPELLPMLADANFDLLFIGIETPNKASLREVQKMQNIAGDLDMVSEVRTILSYGMSIRAGIIVGFDHDDLDIFDTQYNFIQDACIPSVSINTLKAPFGTRLWTRLRQEGRVVAIPRAVRDLLGHPRSHTTILPKNMSRIELMAGCNRLLERVFSWESFAERTCGFISIINRKPALLEAEPTPDVDALAARIDADAEAREAIGRMIRYTAEHAPFMLSRVRALICQHATYRKSIAGLLPEVDRQIELESSGVITFEQDTRPILIPPAFRAAYKTFFPQVYRRVYLNLHDKEQLPDALVEVFADFLVRWGASFTQLEDHHYAFFDELCDRTCAKCNGQAPETFEPVTDETASVPDVRRRRLDDDILQSVGQTLLRVAAGAG